MVARKVTTEFTCSTQAEYDELVLRLLEPEWGNVDKTFAEGTKQITVVVEDEVAL